MKLWMKDGKLLATNGVLHGGDEATPCCCEAVTCNDACSTLFNGSVDTGTMLDLSQWHETPGVGTEGCYWWFISFNSRIYEYHCWEIIFTGVINSLGVLVGLPDSYVSPNNIELPDFSGRHMQLLMGPGPEVDLNCFEYSNYPQCTCDGTTIFAGIGDETCPFTGAYDGTEPCSTFDDLSDCIKNECESIFGVGNCEEVLNGYHVLCDDDFCYPAGTWQACSGTAISSGLGDETCPFTGAYDGSEPCSTFDDLSDCIKSECEAVFGVGNCEEALNGSHVLCDDNFCYPAGTWQACSGTAISSGLGDGTCPFTGAYDGTEPCSTFDALSACIKSECEAIYGVGNCEEVLNGAHVLCDNNYCYPVGTWQQIQAIAPRKKNILKSKKLESTPTKIKPQKIQNNLMKLKQAILDVSFLNSLPPELKEEIENLRKGCSCHIISKIPGLLHIYQPYFDLYFNKK